MSQRSMERYINREGGNFAAALKRALYKYGKSATLPQRSREHYTNKKLATLPQCSREHGPTADWETPNRSLGTIMGRHLAQRCNGKMILLNWCSMFPDGHGRLKRVNCCLKGMECPGARELKKVNGQRYYWASAHTE